MHYFFGNIHVNADRARKKKELEKNSIVLEWNADDETKI